jgi:hypothetical protein
MRRKAHVRVITRAPTPYTGRRAVVVRAVCNMEWEASFAFDGNGVHKLQLGEMLVSAYAQRI